MYVFVTSCLQEELRKKMVEETVPKYMAAFDKLLGDQDYLVGNEVLRSYLHLYVKLHNHACVPTNTSF